MPKAPDSSRACLSCALEGETGCAALAEETEVSELLLLVGCESVPSEVVALPLLRATTAPSRRWSVSRTMSASMATTPMSRKRARKRVGGGVDEATEQLGDEGEGGDVGEGGGPVEVDAQHGQLLEGDEAQGVQDV